MPQCVHNLSLRDIRWIQTGNFKVITDQYNSFQHPSLNIFPNELQVVQGKEYRKVQKEPTKTLGAVILWTDGRFTHSCGIVKKQQKQRNNQCQK